MSKPIKWPLNKRIWHFFHSITNKIAWKYANPGGPTWGRALRINNKHPLWRLNNWVADHYTIWWIEQKTGKKFPSQTK